MAGMKAHGQRLKAGEDCFGEIVTNVENALDMAQGADAVIVCSMVKTRETFADMEPFYDEWRKRNAISIIKGYNDYCGFTEDENVMNMCPPARFPCNSLMRQMMILADGSMVVCAQDFEGSTIFGNVNSDSLKYCVAKRGNGYIAAKPY